MTDASARYPGQLSLEATYPDALNEVIVNACYLYEHGLLDLRWKGQLVWGSPDRARITAKGLDFLAGDGGLSSVLGVVTIRLHEESIKQLLLVQLDRSTAPPPVKQKLADQIRSLPADVTKEVALRAVGADLERIPDLAGWLSSLIDRQIYPPLASTHSTCFGPLPCSILMREVESA